MGVSAVDDDVTLVEQGDQLLDEVVHGLSGLDHQEDLAGALERSHEILEAVGSVDVLALAASFDESVNLFYRAVEYTDVEAFAFHIEDQVLAHYGKTDESDVRNSFHFICSLS